MDPQRPSPLLQQPRSRPRPSTHAVSDRASFVSEDSEVPTEEDCSDGEGVL
ncbi:Delta(8)-fatty-acid desaturase [Senna tora]|uniref:Delta(8)-fatty-acid desaturase n=1 Tax=Senna tora TaxID=362788 RepID=A0A834TUR1_9FABA|nr:Delta(8)-fatty-acid desaturase [Senna tora]